MYERTEDGRLDFSHNPFSMPQGGLEALKGTRWGSMPSSTTSPAMATS
jgi:hypothetical protein